MLLKSLHLLGVPSPHISAARSIGMINKQRRLKNESPRRAESIWYDTPEFSFVDGRGISPLSIGQRRRYLRNKHMCKQVIDYMKQFETAKQLRPDSQLSEYTMQEHPRKVDVVPTHPRTMPL